MTALDIAVPLLECLEVNEGSLVEDFPRPSLKSLTRVSFKKAMIFPTLLLSWPTIRVLYLIDCRTISLRPLAHMQNLEDLSLEDINIGWEYGLNHEPSDQNWPSLRMVTLENVTKSPHDVRGLFDYFPLGSWKVVQGNKHKKYQWTRSMGTLFLANINGIEEWGY